MSITPLRAFIVEQDAVRLQVGGTIISVAAHFWNEGLKQRTCLRCAKPLGKCGCTEASDLLELPKSACKVDKTDGSVRGAMKVAVGNASGSRCVGVEVRIPRDRKGNGSNAWLRKLITLPGSSRLPKVMHLAVRVTNSKAKSPISPPLSASATVPEYQCFEGYSRLVAKNGGVKEKALLSVRPDAKGAQSEMLMKSKRKGGRGKPDALTHLNVATPKPKHIPRDGTAQVTIVFSSTQRMPGQFSMLTWGQSVCELRCFITSTFKVKAGAAGEAGAVAVGEAVLEEPDMEGPPVAAVAAAESLHRKNRTNYRTQL